MTFGISYIIYNKINQEKFDESLKLLNENKLNISKQEYYSLMIRTLVGKKQYKNVEQLLFDKNINLMKRDYMTYIKEIYLNNSEKSETIFKLVLKKYELNDCDIDFIIKNNFKSLLKLLNRYYLKTSLNYNYEYTGKLKLFDFNNNEIESIYKKLSSKIFKNCHYNFEGEIVNKKFSHILDGGNILLSNKGKNNLKSYKFLLSMMNNIEEPLLVIHKKYLKNNKSNQINNIINIIKKKFINNIYMTPYRNNDDYYILLSSLKLKIPIISNDNFKDHIFDVRSDIFKSYIERYVLKYNNLEIEKLKSYSECIQIIDNQIYIPSKNGNFYKII